jgi:hypothetical protein
LVTILVMCAWALAGCAQDPRADKPRGKLGGLASEWCLIQEAMGLEVQDARILEMQLSVDYDTQDIKAAAIAFYVPRDGGSVHFAQRLLGEAAYRITSSRPSYPMDPGEMVPLDDLIAQVDLAGLDVLAYHAGEYSWLEVSLVEETGQVLGIEPGRTWFLLEDGITEELGDTEVAVASGRLVYLFTAPVGDRSGDTGQPKRRGYLLTGLGGTVSRVTLKPPDLQAGEEWITSKLADLDGDGLGEVIHLVGTRSEEHLPAPDRKWLLVGSGSEALRLEVPSGDTQYGTHFELRDLTGDGCPEMLFYEYIGGSGNIVDLNVFSLRNGGLWPLFVAADHHNIPGIHVEYLGDNMASLYLPSLGLAWVFPLCGSYQGSIVSPQFHPDWVDPFSDYDLVDLDGDGAVEIIGHQRVCGSAHVDIIADLRQVFSWNGEAFVLQDVLLGTPGWGGELIEPFVHPPVRFVLPGTTGTSIMYVRGQPNTGPTGAS